MYLFSFLSALVELDVFDDISVDFMLVGHTGNQVDQIFSIFASEFKTEIRSPDELLEKIRNSAVNPKPICEELTVIWDWKGWVKPNMSESKLQNHSFLHSFLVKKEGETGVLRGRKYPQDTGPWLPEDGIKLLKDGVDFGPIGTADVRVEKLGLDEIFQGLYTRYFPQMGDQERRKAQSSWEKLRKVLEDIPKKENFPKMRLSNLPKQERNVRVPDVPSYLVPFQSNEVRELSGSKHVQEPEASVFETEVRPGMDILLYTRQKATRPWLGKVLSISPGGKTFSLQWYKRKSRALVFHASVTPDGSPFTATMSTDSVMLWNFADNKTVDSFDVSPEWYEKILKSYSDHDACYI